MHSVFKRFLGVWGIGRNRFRLRSEWGVTRLDRLDTYVDALMEIHPELKNHPLVIDFRERNQACEEELKG
jgi:hypothetical protein